MALQGTIDAFPLVDVVQMLGASRKTGRLTVDGDRGTARIWVVDGELVAAEHGGESLEDGVRALAELLRPASGDFVFDPDEEVSDATLVPVPLLELLPDASAVLEEWRAIEAVVPSSQHRPVPVSELPDGADTVTLDARDWQLIVAAAGGVTVGELVETLGVHELEVGRAVARLVERDLLTVEEPEGSADEPVRGDTTQAGTADEPSPPIDLSEEPAEETFPDHFPIDDLVSAGDDDDPWSTLEGDEDRFAAAQPFADAGFETGSDGPPAFADPSLEGQAFDSPAFDAAPSGSSDLGAQAFEAPAFGSAVGDGSDPAPPGAAASFEASPFDAPFDGSAFDAPFDGTAFDGTAFDVPAFETPGAQVQTAFDGTAFDAPAFEAPAFGTPAFEPEPVAFEPLPDEVTGAGDASDVQAGRADEVDGTEEILRQMSRLSPKAADAIAAALGTAADATAETADDDDRDGA